MSYRLDNKLKCVLTALVTVSVLLVSCRKEPTSLTTDERRTADSIVRATRGIDSLAQLQQRLEEEGDRLGSIVALREWGKQLRNESRFDEALRVHSEGLRQAEELGDTLEWVQALNNVGTDYRRMGVLDVAQGYHYRAWTMSEACADTSYTAKKNRVVSLNGLGNIYMTLGNYERADSALRLALRGEEELQSDLGLAINYANLGSIYEHREQTDSAWVYYRRSMRYNEEAGSTLGISLCHTYFGSLYEKAGEYERATAEYEEAYRMMQESKDEWHALNSLIALAGIYCTTGDDTRAMDYLGRAEQMAQLIRSNEHLTEINTLYYKHYKRLGDYRSALSAYEQAVALRDSVLSIEKVNRIQNTSLYVERIRQEREMAEAQLRLEQERSARHTAYVFFALVLLVLIGAMVTFLYIQRIQRRNHVALKRLVALRENFFTNITHEFRTPLTVILGLSRDLQDSDDEAVSEKAQTIERQGEGLLALINQLLDISKIRSSVGDADWRSGDITIQLTMIVESWRDYARSRNVDLQLYSKEPVVMDFVPDYVTKVLNNLISNSLKYTPEYGCVSISSWRRDDRLRIDVSDTGSGMDEETLAHVFEPFYQGESDAKHVGTGVGLALVKQIVDAVQGTIAVESEPGRGTTFRLSIPIRNQVHREVAVETTTSTPSLPREETMPTDSDEGDDDKCRLLVIEDNSDIAAYIGSQFAGRYAVSYAADGREGLDKALDQVPDLIITDLMMPGVDGLEVCRQIRGSEITDHIPIIVVTAKITEEERIRGLEAGADAYLAKPFNADELRMRVEKLLERHHRLRDKYSSDTDKQQESQYNDVERRFLAKVSDVVYLQLSRGKRTEVSQIASALCMSDRQFYRKIRAITSSTPTAYIQRIKIKKAKSLLDGDAEMSFGEIAERCGFSDYSNFVRTFKSAYGVTPTVYRRSGAGDL